MQVSAYVHSQGSATGTAYRQTACTATSQRPGRHGASRALTIRSKAVSQTMQLPHLSTSAPLPAL